MNSIIVFSDLHCLFNPTFDYWKEFFQHLDTTYPNAFILCLGDMDVQEEEAFLEYKDRIVFLRGNNDFNRIKNQTNMDYGLYGVEQMIRDNDQLLTDSCSFTIAGISFYAIHGHRIGNKYYRHPYTRQEWKEYKKALNMERKIRECDYLLYGHSHRYEYDQLHHLINPGSCNEILSDGEAGYIEIQIDRKKVKVIHHLLEKK